MASVAGAAGEEIHPDQYGRIKLWFPWDRNAKKDGTDKWDNPARTMRKNNCATHKFRRNSYEIRIFRYISSEKIGLKLSQLKERHHDGHDIRI
ncbi:hypothetical protein [Agrobacterium tumefaciens]|uniref:hypothetical protein n=1 Tax=Agrobacterium tumefaciens TaxID=358 RepID=UPI0009B72E3C